MPVQVFIESEPVFTDQRRMYDKAAAVQGIHGDRFPDISSHPLCPLCRPLGDPSELLPSVIEACPEALNAVSAECCNEKQLFYGAGACGTVDTVPGKVLKPRYEVLLEREILMAEDHPGVFRQIAVDTVVIPLRDAEVMVPVIVLVYPVDVHKGIVSDGPGEDIGIVYYCYYGYHRSPCHAPFRGPAVSSA